MLKRATYYMVECDYPHETDAQRIAFDEFYWDHVSMLLTIPGFLSAQRFHCDQPVKAPFLASVAVAKVVPARGSETFRVAEPVAKHV